MLVGTDQLPLLCIDVAANGVFAASCQDDGHLRDREDHLDRCRLMYVNMGLIDISPSFSVSLLLSLKQLGAETVRTPQQALQVCLFMAVNSQFDAHEKTRIVPHSCVAARYIPRACSRFGPRARESGVHYQGSSCSEFVRKVAHRETGDL